MKRLINPLIALVVVTALLCWFFGYCHFCILLGDKFGLVVRSCGVSLGVGICAFIITLLIEGAK